MTAIEYKGTGSKFVEFTGEIVATGHNFSWTFEGVSTYSLINFTETAETAAVVKYMLPSGAISKQSALTSGTPINVDGFDTIKVEIPNTSGSQSTYDGDITIYTLAADDSDEFREAIGLGATDDVTFNSLTVTTFITVQTMQVEDSLIVVNYGQTGTPTLDGGIEVERGDSTNYKFIFQESSDAFVVGQTGSLQRVATREDTPNDNGLGFWDTSTLKFETAATVTFNGTTLAAPSVTVDNLNLDGNAITSTSGAVAITPLAGQNIDITLATTGNLVINTDDLVFDTSAGFLGLGTATPKDFIHIDVSENSGITSSFNDGLIISSDANTPGIYFENLDASTGERVFKASLADEGIFKFESVTDNAQSFVQQHLMDLHLASGYVSINKSSAATPLHVLQKSTTGAVPVVTFEQLDIDDSFIDFIGTSAADGSRSISSDTTEDSAKFGAVRVDINGVTKWVRIYDDQS